MQPASSSPLKENMMPRTKHGSGRVPEQLIAKKLFLSTLLLFSIFFPDPVAQTARPLSPGIGHHDGGVRQSRIIIARDEIDGRPSAPTGSPCLGRSKRKAPALIEEAGANYGYSMLPGVRRANVGDSDQTITSVDSELDANRAHRPCDDRYVFRDRTGWKERRSRDRPLRWV